MANKLKVINYLIILIVLFIRFESRICSTLNTKLCKKDEWKLRAIYNRNGLKNKNLKQLPYENDKLERQQFKLNFTKVAFSFIASDICFSKLKQFRRKKKWNNQIILFHTACSGRTNQAVKRNSYTHTRANVNVGVMNIKVW